MERLAAKIHEAGLAPEAWPEALKSLTDALGVAGAAYIVSNRQTGRVEWVCFSGLSAEFQSDYIDHYAPLDPFTPLLNIALGWVKLTECLAEPLLRRSEWYNDFVLACGVRDILATRLVETPSHFVTFGLHQQIGRRFEDKARLVIDNVTGPLRSATQQHVGRFFGPRHDESGPEVIVDGAKYFFHVSNGKQYLDETGRVFSTDQEAVAHASVLAEELGQDRDWGGFVISVTHEDGRVIAQVPVHW
jgi:hypothetical protein